MKNYFNYFTEVEEYFVRKRAKNVWVAPLDWSLIELWKDNGIPLNVVLRGIDRSFEAAQKRQKKTPSTLFYCHPAVMEVFGEYQAAMVGGSEPEPEATQREVTLGGDLSPHLDSLIEAMERPDELFTRLKNRLTELRQEVEGRRHVDPEELDRQLNELECLLAEGLEERLLPQERASLKDQVKSETKIYKKHLSKEMYDRLCRSHFRRKILAAEEIPEFTILRV